MHDWARLLPLRVICTMLGIPSVDQEQMGRWTEALSAASGMPTEESRAAGDTAMAAFNAYVVEQVETRRANPRDDLLTALIDAEEVGERLDRDELVAMVVQLMFAGPRDEPEPDRQPRLPAARASRRDGAAALADPTLAPSAVEESLRYDPPITFTSRIAHDDLELCSLPVARGAAGRAVPHRGELRPRPRVGRRTTSTSRGRTTGTCRSAGGSTTVSARASPGSRAPSRSTTLLERFANDRAAGVPSQWTTFTPVRGRERLDLLLTPA